MSVSTTRNEGTPFEGLTGAEIELLQLRSARYAKKSEAQVQESAEAAVFSRGSMHYGAPLSCLREVRPLREYCRIPGASRCVPGMFHFQGEILSLHDIDAFMHPGTAEKPASWVIILEHGGERLGLMADEMIDIVRVTAGAVRPVPVTFGERAACFQGLLEGNILLLAPGKLFSTSGFFFAF